MSSDDITREQGKQLAEAIGKSLNYLTRLRRRMEKLGFLPGDDYFKAVDKAQDAMQTLYLKTHFLKCEGVMKPHQEAR